MKQRISRHYANVVATIALFAVLTGVGAAAAGKVQIVTGKQIKNGSISTKDLANNSVRAADIKNGGVTSADIGVNQVKRSDIASNQITSDEIAPGEVTPEEVTLPEPASFKLNGNWSAMVNQHAAKKVVTLGTYAKQDATSALKVDWVGLAKSFEFGCIYELRVDGISEGAGTAYAYDTTALSVSASSLFTGLGAGDHAVEVWARTAWGDPAGTEVRCAVGVPEVALPQSVVVAEIVN
ncbi:MAG TPA: hypothetical protein VEW67_03980 [Thermoleophilaceae bacterium]|nr:hypothetical protein [Thermoleophilaceae bacterium]